jgi:hypothetical protein
MNAYTFEKRVDQIANEIRASDPSITAEIERRHYSEL